jgi:hypothetical protein
VARQAVLAPLEALESRELTNRAPGLEERLVWVPLAELRVLSRSAQRLERAELEACRSLDALPALGLLGLFPALAAGVAAGRLSFLPVRHPG